MRSLKVVKVTSDIIEFNDGTILYSDHNQDCCENHYLYLEELTLNDFEGLFFDLSNDKFFKKIEGYGIELVPIFGHSVKIAGHGYNNGYYGTNLDLCIRLGEFFRKYDITECQIIND